MTGVEVPKYYNPAAVNPLKYAEQIKKRKLLWSKAKEKKEVLPQISFRQILSTLNISKLDFIFFLWKFD